MQRRIEELELAVARKETRTTWKLIRYMTGKSAGGQAMPSKDENGNGIFLIREMRCCGSFIWEMGEVFCFHSLHCEGWDHVLASTNICEPTFPRPTFASQLFLAIWFW